MPFTLFTTPKTPILSYFMLVCASVHLLLCATLLYLGRPHLEVLDKIYIVTGSTTPVPGFITSPQNDDVVNVVNKYLINSEVSLSNLPFTEFNYLSNLFHDVTSSDIVHSMCILSLHPLNIFHRSWNDVRSNVYPLFFCLIQNLATHPSAGIRSEKLCRLTDLTICRWTDTCCFKSCFYEKNMQINKTALRYMLKSLIFNGTYRLVKIRSA